MPRKKAIFDFPLTNYRASDRISDVERPHRLGDQDAALSRLKREFESLWGHQTNTCESGCFCLHVYQGTQPFLPVEGSRKAKTRVPRASLRGTQGYQTNTCASGCFCLLLLPMNPALSSHRGIKEG